MTGHGTRRAFTLIELLVVVAIIALLLAILMPSLGRARESSKATVCMSNMRSLGIALQTYATINGGQLVSAGLAHGGSVDEHAAWINVLKSEYQNELVARCPVDRSSYWQRPWADTKQFRRASFGTNYYTVRRIGDRGPYNRMNLFRYPATTIWLVELAEEGEYAVSDHVHPETWWADPARLSGEEMEPKRHRGEANYCFIDGHVERLPFEQTYQIDLAGGFPPKFLHNLYDPEIAH